MIKFNSPAELKVLQEQWDPQNTGLLGVYTGLAAQLAQFTGAIFPELVNGNVLTFEMGMSPPGQAQIKEALQKMGSPEEGTHYFQRVASAVIALFADRWLVWDIEVILDGWGVQFSIAHPDFAEAVVATPLPGVLRVVN